MITTKESIKQVLNTSSDSSDKNAAHLAGSIAENLQDGEYLLSMIPTMVIFIRTNDWSPEMSIEHIDFQDTCQIRLSTGRTIELYGPQISSALTKVDHYRIVLLSDQGYSSFKVSNEEDERQY